MARANLLREGIPESSIHVTGNTVIDALLSVANQEFDITGTMLQGIPFDKRIILVTAHRRESFGQPIRNICEALRTLAEQHASDIHLVYPVHPNPNIKGPVDSLLSSVRNVTLLPPLSYRPFVHLMKQCTLILTDSGGIQEEAPSLGRPVLVLREVTERPEAVRAGAVQVVGTETSAIVVATSRLLEDRQAYESMARARNPYGDGRASERIVRAILAYPDRG
jgi:UDP-N-acetylglucosamine 2-epimerase (non-hydrolysing)